MYTEALAPKTKKAFELLGTVEMVQQFYLAGGTAAALYLGHRFSHDLDFFSTQRFDSELLRLELEKAGKLAIEFKKKDTLLGKFNGVKISFFYYPYPLLNPLNHFSSVAITDPKDIGAMKINAIAGRGIKRDFIDLYFLIKANQWQLVEVIAWFTKKYKKSNYNMVHVLNALIYFADADTTATPQMIKPVNWNKVKEYFHNAVKKIEL
ncbi:nucleotidyl transferase AbiEii/AbiGii toxin family protein [Candidatus Berkelbacteria bacterium]|nr:nucleotidyl transferase AbiEii/AbiGii toxin family protein [Candidatus Berkelbacteria bacterium]